MGQVMEESEGFEETETTLMNNTFLEKNKNSLMKLGILVFSSSQEDKERETLEQSLNTSLELQEHRFQWGIDSQVHTHTSDMNSEPLSSCNGHVLLIGKIYI